MLDEHHGADDLAEVIPKPVAGIGEVHDRGTQGEVLGQLDVGEEVYRHSILKEVVGELADLLITIEALDEACLVDVLCLEEVCA